MHFDGPVRLDGAVTAFRGSHFTLSNFYPHPITIDRHTYPTVEHYYQAAKAVDPADHDRIRDAATPAEAKQLGREVRCVPGWSESRIPVMRRGLDAKYTLDSVPGVFLLGTGHVPLVEGNDWDDRFWGVCESEGANLLGILLTERRGVLRHLREAGSEV